MFGLLVGTLTKNKGQEKSESALKRQLIEVKLQEKLKKEKLELAERIELEEKERKNKAEQDKKQADVDRIRKMVFILFIMKLLHLE